MIIGAPREIKNHEYRASMTPDGVADLVREGHTVLVEPGLGMGSGFEDQAYKDKGAHLCAREELFSRAELIVKVKEPLEQEYALLKEGQALFTYLHLAPNPALTALLIDRKVTALAYETLVSCGTTPLLIPMSEIAGRIAAIMGAYYLQRPAGGMGLLPSGAPGVPPARALVIGAGAVGTNAARLAHAIGMEVTVINKGHQRLSEIDQMFDGQVHTLPSSHSTIEDETSKSDIVICGVYVRGESAPKLITCEMIKGMKKGSVLVDVAIDQGGCAETSRPTTHDNPVYTVDGVIHYAVANMPGAYPRTSTLALTQETLPYIQRIASAGVERAIREDQEIRTALNTYRGMIMHEGLAKSICKPLGSL